MTRSSLLMATACSTNAVLTTNHLIFDFQPNNHRISSHILLTLNLTISSILAVLLMPSHERKNEGATLTPRASAFIRFVSLLAVIVRNVPQINTRRRCVSGGRSPKKRRDKSKRNI